MKAKPKDQGQTCSQCMWFRRVAPNAGAADFGECRRYPPHVIVMPDPMTESSEPMSAFPLVDLDEFCGEFKGAN